MRVGVVVASTFALLMAWYLRNIVPWPLIAAWLAAKLLIAVLRMAQGAAFARSYNFV